MPQFLATTDPDFEPRFATLLAQKREADADVDADVAAILAEVAARGDAALIELTDRFDRLRLTPATLAFSEAEIDAAVARVDPEDRAALELAAARIRAYHERQRPEDARWTDASRRRARLALDAGRRRRPLRAGRPRLLPVVGPDERHPGARRRRRAAGDLRPDPRRHRQPAGALPPPASPGSRPSTASAAPRRSPPSPTAPRRSRRSTRSPAPATPGSPPPSAGCSAASAST